MDVDDLTATVREARAERDEATECLAIACKARDAQRLRAWRAVDALLEIRRSVYARTAHGHYDLRGSDIIEIAERGLAGREAMLAGAPSRVDACTVRDTTTDQSKARNGAGMTQAEREEFWGGLPFKAEPFRIDPFSVTVNGRTYVPKETNVQP